MTDPKSGDIIVWDLDTALALLRERRRPEPVAAELPHLEVEAIVAATASALERALAPAVVQAKAIADRPLVRSPQRFEVGPDGWPRVKGRP